MRICVFGAGAVGGHVATRLLAAGTAEVSVVARGAALKGMRERGLTLLYNGSEKIHAPVPVATDDPSTLQAQDYVVVTLKACALPAAADAVARLLKPDGCAVFLNNGIPWWWPQGIDGQVWLHRHDPPAAARAGWIAACLNTPWPRSSWTACTSRTKSLATAARGGRSCPAGGGRWKACAGWRGTSRPQAIACSYTAGAMIEGAASESEMWADDLHQGVDIVAPEPRALREAGMAARFVDFMAPHA